MQKICLLVERENNNDDEIERPARRLASRRSALKRRIITLLLTKANKTVVTVTRQRQAIWDFAGSSVEEC